MNTDKQPMNGKFNIAKILYDKLMLIVALCCEIVAYLMTRGVLEGSAQVINGLTVAGVVIMFIYLVTDGLKRKYKQYSKKWGFAPSAGESADESDSCQDSEPQK